MRCSTCTQANSAPLWPPSGTSHDHLRPFPRQLAHERLAAALEADVNVHLHQLKDYSNEYDSKHSP